MASDENNYYIVLFVMISFYKLQTKLQILRMMLRESIVKHLNP